MRTVGIFSCAISMSFALTAFAQSEAIQATVASEIMSPRETRSIEINTAAKVVLAEGDVSIVDADNRGQEVKVGDVISEGDLLITGKDGELHLQMDDGGYIALRPNTKMRFTSYQARGADSDNSIISLFYGSLRAISGWIGKFNQPKYGITTPTATIGLRGTDHEPMVIPQGATDTDAEPGTYDKVNIGSSTIATAEGKTEIMSGQAGFAGHDRNVPRLLKDTPAFYRAHRNEKLLDGKHEAIQQVIVELRDARKAAKE